MKRQFYLFFVLLLGFFSVNAQQVLVTDKSNVTSPTAGAMFDVDSDSKGFMLPRVALTGFKDVTTIPSRTTGLMVYNNGTAGLTDKGIYFWNDTVWVKQLSAGSSSTSYVTIAGDGTVKLNGGATTFNDLVVPVYSARNSTNSTPGWSEFAEPNFFTFAFAQADGDNDKEVFFNIQMPHDYKEGTTIYPHVHWSNVASLGTTRPVWKVEFQWVNLHDSYINTTPTPAGNILTGYNIVQTGGGVESTPSNVTEIRKSMITPLGSIAGTGKTVSSMIIMRLTRLTTDSNDNFNDAAYLMSFDIHYEIDSFGSKDQYVK